MRYVKWTFWLLIFVLVGGFLHYTLPQHDIVRIAGIENRRIDIGENSIFWSRAEVGMTDSTSRDVFFINAVYPNGKTMEYRNEDTGWGWPPYFKIDSFGLQTRTKDLVSTASDPVWVQVTHYGWRNKFFTIVPNAVSVKRVAGGRDVAGGGVAADAAAQTNTQMRGGRGWAGGRIMGGTGGWE